MTPHGRLVKAIASYLIAKNHLDAKSGCFTEVVTFELKRIEKAAFAELESAYQACYGTNIGPNE